MPTRAVRDNLAGIAVDHPFGMFLLLAPLHGGIEVEDAPYFPLFERRREFAGVIGFEGRVDDPDPGGVVRIPARALGEKTHHLDSGLMQQTLLLFHKKKDFCN